MTPSFGEVQATGLKAARGAGLPWGLCEDAGSATRWLWERGYNGPGALAALLSNYDPDTCPLRAAGRLPGEIEDLPFELQVQAGLLLLPSLAAIGAQADGVGDTDFGTAKVVVEAATADWVPAIGPRRAVDQAAWQILKRLEGRTYAPPTEASRDGAGAGLTDND
ncbi:MAG: DUF3726 domain-containing protein [Pseudomonadota bacterium]